ncbi:hypothetical protein [Roseomonas indoligenes]|uniref:Uncharacterized protein n=1 Tax=Roseomonas indoligenes TaxID=2820811 RepID=A0A940S725_9PROT|nr:hypothetical protein [Pararoseomonas indoligenes]MBP0494624.1 hypothetical protein [Pararoseomonas indoligenes]
MNNAAQSEAAWNNLPEPLQIALAQEALRHAVGVLAGHAETLADEIESGTLLDQGGPGALRLFQAVIRSMHRGDLPTVGNA